MKKLMFAIAVAACAFAQGAMVTPRQMTNFVNEAKTELREDIHTVQTNLESKIQDATPEGYQEIATLARGAIQSGGSDWATATNKAYSALPNTSAVQASLGLANTAVQPAALSAVDSALATTATLLRAQIEAATPDQYETVKSRALSAIQTLAPATNYTDQIASILNNRINSISGEETTDLETYFAIDDEATYVVVQKIVGGITTNMKYRVYPSLSSESVGACWGAKVISTDSPYITKGMTFARTGTASAYSSGGGGKYKSSYSSVFGERIQFECKSYNNSASGSGVVNYWNSYTITNEVTTGSGGKIIIGGAGTDLNISCTETHYNSSGIITAQYGFTVEPFKMLVETWEAACGESWSENSGDDAWADSASDIETQRNITFSAQAANAARPFSLMSLFIGTAYADELVSVIGLTPYYKGIYISSWDSKIAKDGQTPETHSVNPKSAPDPDQWYDMANWGCKYPENGVTVIYIDEYGNQVQASRKIRNEDSALALLKQTSWSIPAWTSPTFKEKNNKCYAGHIWGKDCVCTECGETRSHSYNVASGGSCSRCKNQLTKYKLDDDDIKIPDGLLSTTCGHACDYASEAYHAGWYHLDVGDDTGNFCCACECGHFGKSNPYAHNFEEQSAETSWTDAGDEEQHYANLYCERDCGHYSTVYQGHIAGTATSDKTIPKVNSSGGSSQHYYKSNCTAKGCGGTCWGVADHQYDDSVEPCWCVTCEQVCHWSGIHQCGDNTWGGCDRCGITTEGGHDFDPPVDKGNDSHHYCQCGLDMESHTFVNGVCACGHKQPSSDNKCGHNKRNKSGGTPDEGDPDSGGIGGKSKTQDHPEEPDPNPNRPYSKCILNGVCPACGGSFSTDYPNANWDKECYWVVSYTPPSGGEKYHIKGYATTLTRGMSDCMATFETAYMSKQNGANFTVTMEFTSTYSETEYAQRCGFYDRDGTTTGTVDVKEQANYSGTVKNNKIYW